MARLLLSTAGESHGPALVAVLEGLPHGLAVTKEAIDTDLRRRQMGYGRGGRMKIERDEVEVLAGLRGGRTLGSPLAMVVRNRDHAKWTDVMDPFSPPTGAGAAALTRPRPGHVDLAGALKLGIGDARDVLERSSARSTAARVAAGAVAKAFLRDCGIELLAHVTRIGEVEAPPLDPRTDEGFAAARERAEASEVRCADPVASRRMVEAIAAAQQDGDSLGGICEVVAWNVPPGLGSHAEWTDRLDGRIALALMSIQAMKGVEVGMGFAAAHKRGSQVHDPILPGGEGGRRFVRPTNNAGGIEGGLTNGEPVVARVAMKPIPTLARPLPSVDLVSGQPFDAQKERTDACAVPAAAVVAEAALAFVLADALLDKTGGDTMDEVRARLAAYRERLARG
jgi:chorismate synthase